jgi:hypothetical protein
LAEFFSGDEIPEEIRRLENGKIKSGICPFAFWRLISVSYAAAHHLPKLECLW